MKETWRLLRAAIWMAPRQHGRAARLLIRARDELALELLRVGDGLIEQGHTDNAVEVYGKALRADPDSGEVRLGVLERLVKLGWDAGRTGAFMDAADRPVPE